MNLEASEVIVVEEIILSCSHLASALEKVAHIAAFYLAHPNEKYSKKVCLFASRAVINDAISTANQGLQIYGRGQNGE